MYSYIWIEGEKNLNEFCIKRFGDKPHFMETIGRVSGKGASAKVHLIYKYPADDVSFGLLAGTGQMIINIEHYEQFDLPNN